MYTELLKSKEYDFLRTNKMLGKNIILLGLGGSRAYGTNLPDSDIDIRGAAIRRKEDILLGKDFENIVDKTTDTTVYSLDKMVHLLAQCNPNTIEILGLEPEDYLYVSEAGEELLRNKQVFLSNRCINTFNGYVMMQLYRLKSKTNQTLTTEELSGHIADVLNNMLVNMGEKYGFDKSDIRFYADADAVNLDIVKKNCKVDNLINLFSEFNNTLRDYRKRSKRNEYALTHEKIAKHSMHLLRAYIMGIDLISEAKIQTKRIKEHDLLMDVRNGKYLDGSGMPTKEFFEIVDEYKNKFENAVKHSVLPDTPDMDKINKLLISLNEAVIYI